MSAGHTPRSFVLASHGGSAGAGAAPPATHAASCSDAWPGNSPDAHPASSMAMVPDRSWARSPGPSAACGAGTGGHGASATKVPGWGDTPRLTREAPPDRDRSGSHWPAAPSWGIDDTPGLSAVAACGATVPAVTVPSLGLCWPGGTTPPDPPGEAWPGGTTLRAPPDPPARAPPGGISPGPPA